MRRRPLVFDYQFFQSVHFVYSRGKEKDRKDTRGNLFTERGVLIV